jgi:2-haloacid dehalogenase
MPRAIVFDVNETLSDMSPMADRFAEVGAPEQLAKLWFASILRDGFAVTVAERQEQFSTLARENLRVLLGPVGLDRDQESAIEHVMSGFLSLPLHPDVVPAVHALSDAGHRLMTLTNGSVQVAETLLDRAGIRTKFEQLLSVEEAGVWKPARAAYQYAARCAGLDLSDMLLVAAHPWDIDGAAGAGMRTAWVNRSDGAYPGFAAGPDLTVTSLADLAGAARP